MGFHNHLVIKCHTCKARKTVGGNFTAAEKAGWHFGESKGAWVWFCPTCNKKVATRGKQ